MQTVLGHNVRCILFDLGSTLWIQQDEAAAQAKKHACIQAGKLLRKARGGEIFSSRDALDLGILVRKAFKQQLHLPEHQKPGYEPDYVRVTMDALRTLGLSCVDRALGESIFEALRIRIPDAKVLFADTSLVLAELKRRGYLLGVVTNRAYGGQPFREDLQAMGLLNYFEYRHMAISADLGIRKPHPGIFNYALTGLNIAPEEAAMVGDNLVADVAGARSLNMLGIWKPKPSLSQEARTARRSEQDTLPPDATIEHLSDLLAMF